MIRPSRFVCPAVALMTVVFGACARRGAAPVTSASPATPVPAASAPASPVAARPVTVVPNPN
ncbi:MAG: hypothetical protein ACK5HM_09780, partial [Gemmatimonas sp.]